MRHEYDFSSSKNQQLKQERHISFEEIISVIEEGNALDVVEHPNKKKYPKQKMYVIEIEAYVYLVPFVEEGDRIFLKTIFPSRKATKDRLKHSEH